MILRPSAANQWMVCGQTAHQSPARAEEDNDPAREGTAAAWLAEQVFQGRAKNATELVGKFAENDWPIDEEMAGHVQEYVDLMNKRQNCEPGRAEHFITGPQGVQGTADHTQWKLDRTFLYITDLKYGYQQVEPTTWQLAVYLWLQLTELAPREYPNMVQLAIYQPRGAHREGAYRKLVISQSEYMPLMQQITKRVLELNAGESTAVPGRHCKNCALAAGCEALGHTVYDIAQFSHQSRHYKNPTSDQMGAELKMLRDTNAMLGARISAVEAEAEARINEGQFIPGWTIEKKYGKKKFMVDDATVQMLTGIDPAATKTCTPAELIRRGADKKVVETITEKPFIGAKLSPLKSDEIAARFAAVQNGGTRNE